MCLCDGRTKAVYGSAVSDATTGSRIYKRLLWHGFLAGIVPSTQIVRHQYLGLATIVSRR